MSKLFIIGGIVVLALVGGVLVLSQAGTSGPGGSAASGLDERIVGLSFTDYEGNSVVLSDFGRKPLVVNTWAVWCPFCVKELGEFVALQKELPEITVVAIDRAESLQTAKTFTDDLGFTEDLVFLLDPQDSFYRAIGGFSMPETLFIDKEGVVQDHKRGPMDLEEMKRRVQKIL